MTTRRGVLTAGAALLPMSAAAATAVAPARIFEWTFLKSIGEDPTSLAKFIRANWFAMDAKSVQRGLMTGYALHVAADPGDWNVVVIVGYPDRRGYAGIAPVFEEIRRAHVTVDGPLSKHGRIVASRKLLPDGEEALT
ncbi:hypothetical protein [Glacieibacterium frigidum]|uniref:Uncharacterized protein n=1 Tax=Glacieibacterium frigidum TaxID=2593303 RepID=A0A552UIC1_9SPHN|nr:hypothetical protein [Glacieibacterium frigidum]TRW17978.1 hypothetical protein FMM06_07610 [Glacieibacterium frigidum]